MDPKPRVLVVDDEFGIREGCRLILDMEGFEVDLAADGLAGLELFEKNRNYDIGLIDLKMPRMGGLELIEKIRARDEDMVLFVITAYAAFDTAVEATKRGAWGYIPKPFTPDELLLPIRRGLERRALALEARRLREERESRMLEIAAERGRSAAILRVMSDGVLVVNRDRELVLMNHAARRILPGADGLSLPAPLSALPGAGGLAELFAEAAGGPGGDILSRELPLGPGVFLASLSALPEAAGGAAGVAAVLHDITALKALETAKSMFVSMVAHEVKRPLGVVEGYLQVVLAGMAGGPEKERQLLERALIRARTLRELVSELMDLSAMETGKFNLKREPLDLSAVLGEALEVAREKAREKNIEVRDDRAADGLLVLADREAMQSVFGNLLDNAVKYTPDCGRVTLAAAVAGNYVRVSVADTGIGMTPPEQEKLFEEFYRAHNEFTARIPGTGLGLSLARRLVEMHHGSIAVTSARGAGSTFTVCIPRENIGREKENEEQGKIHPDCG